MVTAQATTQPAPQPQPVAAQPAAQVQAPDSMQVTGGTTVLDIQIRGNVAISTATIMNRLKVKAGDPYDEAAVNKELKRIYAMGYFNDVFIETEEHSDGVIVIFTVVEKPTLTGIKFEGNLCINQARLKKSLTVKEGDLLDFGQVSQNVTALRGIYIDEGYPNAEVTYRVDTDPKDGKATLVFMITEGVKLKIQKVVFEGNKSVKAGELEKLMSTKPAWWFFQKGNYDEDKFQSDLARLNSYYRSKGFLDAQLSSKMDYTKDSKSVVVTVLVDEGKKYQIGNITIAGNMVFPTEKLKPMIAMKNGDTFDYENIKKDLEKLREYYYDRGYMDAEVDIEQKYDAATGKMDVTYSVEANREVFVGKVNVIGNTKTRDKVVRREVRLYPGEKYDGYKLRRSKERIYNLGYFEDVYFETVPTKDPAVKDLNVTVKETKTGEFSFGGGYSSVDALIGFVQIRQKNFDLLDWPTFTGAGQDLTIRAEGGSNRTNYILSWTDPWILDYPFLFGFDIYREEHNRSGMSGYDYDETRIGGNLRFGKELTEYLKTDFIYNLEEVKLSNFPDDASYDLKKEEGKNLISRGTWGISYDKRDNKFVPSKGYFLGLSIQNAGGPLGGDKNFLKGWINASYYYSIIENVVLEVRGANGLAQAYNGDDDLPIYERFFAGGAQTIRGYKERGVGPRDSGNNVLGGDSLVLGTCELTFPIYENLIKGAAFYDVGNVWADSKDIYTGDFKQGAGVGVRVKTPIGPVKLDLGYPLSDNYDDKKEVQFYFSVSQGF
jgi:outer membrane protein insertion porin family